MLVYSKILETLLKNRISLPMKVLFQVSYLALLLPASIGLMETSLALLIAGLGIYFLLIHRHWGFSLLGVAVYLRIELVILLGILLLVFVFQKKYKLVSVLGYTALGLLPFVIYDFYFFHTIIPQSILAKSTVYSLKWYSTLAFVVFNSLPESIVNRSNIGNVIVGTLFISIVLIGALVSLKEWKEQKNSWPLVFYLWGVCLSGGYILSHAYVFDWYIPLYTLPLLLFGFLCIYSPEVSRKMIIAVLFGGLFLFSTLSLLGVVYSSIKDPAYFRLFESGSRVKAY
jgi:hypothetical protein